MPRSVSSASTATQGLKTAGKTARSHAHNHSRKEQKSQQLPGYLPGHLKVCLDGEPTSILYRERVVMLHLGHGLSAKMDKKIALSAHLDPTVTFKKIKLEMPNPTISRITNVSLEVLKEDFDSEISIRNLDGLEFMRIPIQNLFLKPATATAGNITIRYTGGQYSYSIAHSDLQPTSHKPEQ